MMSSIIRIILVALMLRAVNASAQVYGIPHHFGSGSRDGTSPVAGLTLNGNTLYGTTVTGGTNTYGTIYQVNTDGSGYAIIRSLTSSDYPESTMVLIGDTLYGSTFYGGTNGTGSIFKINTDGSSYTVLHHFAAASEIPTGTNRDGEEPSGDIVMEGTTLYGTTQSGGTNGNGTVFKINTDGSGFAVLKTFSATYIGGNLVDNSSLSGYGTNLDGAVPSGGLVLGGTTLYGATKFGGLSNGVVFAVQTDGSAFTVLKYFSGLSDRALVGTNSDGAVPIGGLVLSGGTLYGSTDVGGSGAGGNVFTLKIDGNGFASLHDFSITNDGGLLFNTLLLDGGTLYGNTQYGGISNRGTIFMVFTNGTGFKVLRSLDNITGSQCRSKFIVSSNMLFGTATTGGIYNYGVIFSLTVLPQILSDASFGNQSNAFGFNVTGVSNQLAVIESCTNLISPAWQPLQTNLLIGSPIYFSDPAFSRAASTFYRIFSP